MSLSVGPMAATTDKRGETSRVRLLGPDTISLHRGAVTEVVRCRDVISARSVGNYTEIVAAGRTLKVRCPLKTIIATLTSVGLVQVRKGVAVNGARVCRLVGSGKHRLVLELEGGVCVHVGRPFQSVIRARFGSRPRSNRNRVGQESARGA